MSAVGVVLAGGLGRRIGGDKAIVELDGRPLLHYPLDALTAVTTRQAVVVKNETVLPVLPEHVEVWIEPAEPRHPLTGVLHALACARRAPVLCCAVDLPLLGPRELRHLVEARPGRHGVVVPSVEGRVQPLCALWLPRARKALEALPPDVPMRAAVAAADPLVIPYADAGAFANVNAPEDLLTLSRR